MKCQLVQTSKIDDSNRAEKEVLNFIQNLPEFYFVYRELKLTPAYFEQTRGMEEQRPDFVIVGPKTGLVSIEVKDWDLTSNSYEWVDQYQIKKIDRHGNESWLGNPVDQISRYKHGFMELLSSQQATMWVTSLLAFPRISKMSFINQLANIDLLQNPQSRFFLDLERTIFKEDLDKYFLDPEKLFWLILRKDERTFQYGSREIDKVNQTLLPTAFRIGDFSKRQANKSQLRIISEQQREWIFGIDQDMNYLLDVAGSGKTNALISKAIHQIDQKRNTPPKILITTYSRNLETNIRRIFEHKIQDLPGNQIYQQNITIQCIPGLLHRVLETVFTPQEIKDRQSNEPDYESWVRLNVREILGMEPDKFRIFDAIFVDEIQDFDNYFLLVMGHFAKRRKYFFVGDIGQKIYERSYDLQRLGIIPHRIELPKSYQMYRTPQYISRLAVGFIWSDAYCRQDFDEHGYQGQFLYPNTLDYAAEILRSGNPIGDVVSRIRDFLNSHYIHDDILVICSKSALNEISQLFQQEAIPFVIGEPEDDGFIALVAFDEAKGLEREIVFVIGVEDLYDRSDPEGLFWDEEQKIRREGLSRRMIYVALTRTIEQLIIYYKNPSNVFIQDLLKTNQKVVGKRG